MSLGLQLFLLALAAALLSIPVYLATGPGRDPDAAKKGSQFLSGAGDVLVHWFMWVVGPLERVSLRLGLGPDAYNFVGLGCGLLSGIAIGLGWLEWGGWAIVLGGVADILDGRLARALKLASPYGAFIDSTLDRFVEVFAFLGFVYHLRGHAIGPFLAAAAITGSLLVSYTRARGESQGVTCTGGLMQRAERLVLTILVCFADPALSARGWFAPGTAVLWVLGVIAVGTFGTAAHRTVWIARRLREPR